MSELILGQQPHPDSDEEKDKKRHSQIVILITPKKDESRIRSVTWAVNLSLFVNILLLFSKITAFVLTFSFAVVASLIDSVLDLFSQLIIWLTERKIRSKNDQKYPVGKTRLEPVGILTVSVLMIVLSLTVILESIHALAANQHAVEWSFIAVGLLAGLYCLG